jgi:hypothetical protein
MLLATHLFSFSQVTFLPVEYTDCRHPSIIQLPDQSVPPKDMTIGMRRLGEVEPLGDECAIANVGAELRITGEGAG